MNPLSGTANKDNIVVDVKFSLKIAHIKVCMECNNLFRVFLKITFLTPRSIIGISTAQLLKN